MDPVALAQLPQPAEQQQIQTPAKAAPPNVLSPAAGVNPPALADAKPGGAPNSTLPPVTRPQMPQNITWTLGHPPERLRFPADPTVVFTASAGENGVKDLRLAQSTLQDATTFFQLDASRLQLCVDDEMCNTTIDIPANTARRLTLKISPAFRTPGVFAGEISFRVEGKPELQSFKLTVYSRTWYAMLAGAVVIALGLGLYFLVNVWLRRNIATEEALFPAYQLRDTLVILQERCAAARTETGLPLIQLTAALNWLDSQLTPQALAAHLPPAILAPWTSATDWVTNFRAYLTPISDRAGAMVVLINSGIRTVLSYWATHPTAATTAVGQIDALAPAVRNADDAQARLSPILQTLQAAANPLTPAALALVAGAQPGIVARLFTLPPDTHTLQLRLQRNMQWVWWLVALIALLSGFYSVVLQNFGFGSWADYIKCFFWGLGFSVAGTQLEQMAQPAVAANFGITIPKAQ